MKDEKSWNLQETLGGYIHVLEEVIGAAVISTDASKQEFSGIKLVFGFWIVSLIRILWLSWKIIYFTLQCPVSLRPFLHVQYLFCLSTVFILSSVDMPMWFSVCLLFFSSRAPHWSIRRWPHLQKVMGPQSYHSSLWSSSMLSAWSRFVSLTNDKYF